MEIPNNNQSKAQMKSGNVIISGLMGFTAGAIIGILYAPNKGSKTRKQILVKGEKLSEDIKGKYGELGNFISDKIHHTKKDIKELVSSGIAKFDVLKKDLKCTD